MSGLLQAPSVTNSGSGIPQQSLVGGGYSAHDSFPTNALVSWDLNPLSSGVLFDFWVSIFLHRSVQRDAACAAAMPTPSPLSHGLADPIAGPQVAREAVLA